MRRGSRKSSLAVAPRSCRARNARRDERLGSAVARTADRGRAKSPRGTVLCQGLRARRSSKSPSRDRARSRRLATRRGARYSLPPRRVRGLLVQRETDRSLSPVDTPRARPENTPLMSAEGYPSGQRGQTVNLLAYAFVGSNPTPSTT